MNACPSSEILAAFASGQLAPEEEADLAQHLAVCAACRAEASSLRRVAHALRAVPRAPAPDLAESVLAGTFGADAKRHAAWQRPLAIAAGLALVATTVWIAVPRGSLNPEVALQLPAEEPEAASELALATPSASPIPAPAIAPDSAPEDPIARAIDWLVAAQDAGGSWSPQRWGAQANYGVGVSALATLALAAAEDAGMDAPEPLRRGAEYLLQQQDGRGLFGPDITGSLYNHALACLALLEVEQRHPDLVPGERIDAALGLLIESQRDTGGWSYLRARHGAPNTSLTSWALLALIRAEDLGRHGHEAAIARALAWLKATMNEEGRVGYRRPDDFPQGPETLTAAAALCLLGRPSAHRNELNSLLGHVRGDLAQQKGSLDFYRTFFQASALRGAGLADSVEMRDLLARIQQVQERGGADDGSWRADDRWALAGGPVYSTAMAVLALSEM